MSSGVSSGYSAMPRSSVKPCASQPITSPTLMHKLLTQARPPRRCGSTLIKGALTTAWRHSTSRLTTTTQDEVSANPQLLRRGCEPTTRHLLVDRVLPGRPSLRLPSVWRVSKFLSPLAKSSKVQGCRLWSSKFQLMIIGLINRRAAGLLDWGSKTDWRLDRLARPRQARSSTLRHRFGLCPATPSTSPTSVATPSNCCGVGRSQSGPRTANA